MGFRAQMRELLKQEPVVLARVTEKTLPKFDATLTALAQESYEEGMLPVTGDPGESNSAWLSGVTALWVAGDRAADFANPQEADGFASIYEPEHQNVINEWLTAKNMHQYDSGALMEYTSFTKDQPEHAAKALSADKQALAKVFMDDEFRNVRAVTVWVTHDMRNKLDPADVSQIKALGGWPLGSTRYDAGEQVDSTCFLVTRRAFMDALAGKPRP